MAYPAGNVNADQTEVVERVIAAKFQPVGVDTQVIYVDSVAGNDSWPGGGSIAAPYLTIPRAINDIAKVGLLEVSRIILSGAAVHTIPENYVFPATINADIQSADLAQLTGFTAQGPLIIQAAPTLALTVPAVNIISQTPDTTSGLIVLVTNLALVPNAHDGRWMLDSTGILCRIRSNDATTFLLCTAVALTGPLGVYSASATIAPANAGSAHPTLYFRGSELVVLQGLTVNSTAGGSVGVDQGQELVAICCTLPRIRVGEDDAQSPGYLNLQACLMGNYVLHAGGLRMSRSFSDNSLLTGTVTGFLRGMNVNIEESIFETLASALFSDGTFSVPVLSLTNAEVLDSPNFGIQQLGGQLFATSVKVEGGNTAGVQVAANGMAVLGIVAGLNATNGLIAQSGGTVIVTANTTLTGAAGADFLVDGLPAISQTDFRAGTAPFSYKGALSGIIQGADLGFARAQAQVLTTTPLALTGAHQYVFEDATAGNKIINLPTLASARGRVFFLSKSDATASTVTVTPNGAETINGSASVVLSAQFQLVWLIAPSTGTDWKILNAATPSSSGSIVITGGLKGHDVVKAFADTGYVALVTDLVIKWDTSGGACTQNLPALATVRGSFFWIGKTTADANAVTIDANAAETINGALTLALGTQSTAQLYAPLLGTDWMIV